MHIGHPRPRALATLLAGLLTFGSNAALTSSRKISDICKRNLPITAAGAVEALNSIPLLTLKATNKIALRA
jgi:hypothetical protein